MKIISVINYKGGVGKTTLTASIAAYLATQKQKRILLMDMDAQCSLTFSFVTPANWKKLHEGKSKTLKDWYRGLRGEGSPESLMGLMQKSRTGHLSLVPSHLDLLDVDMELATRFATVLDNPGKHPRQYVALLGSLRTQLQAIAEQGIFDLALLDCPPNFNLVTQTAILASDGILIPVRPNPLSVFGVEHLIRKRNDLVDEFTNLSKENFRKPNIMGIVPMMWKVLNEKVQKRIWGNQLVEDGLQDIVAYLEARGEGLPTIFHGIRHNEKLFSEHKPQQVHSMATGEFYGRVKNDIKKTALEFEGAVDSLPNHPAKSAEWWK